MEIDYDADRRREMARRECVRQMEALGRKIGKKYLDSDFSQREYFGSPDEQQRQRQAYGRVDAFIEDLRQNVTTGRNLCLIGSRGTGKDFAMAWAMKQIIRLTQRGVSWWDGANLFTTLKQAAAGNSELSFSHVAYRLSNAFVLAISDPIPPVGSLSPFLAEALLGVIDSRYRQERPTWITLNVSSRREAEERLGALIVDRLFENAEKIFFDWPSYREFRSRTTSVTELNKT